MIPKKENCRTTLPFFVIRWCCRLFWLFINFYIVGCKMFLFRSFVSFRDRKYFKYFGTSIIKPCIALDEMNLVKPIGIIFIDYNRLSLKFCLTWNYFVEFYMCNSVCLWKMKKYLIFNILQKNITKTLQIILHTLHKNIYY